MNLHKQSKMHEVYGRLVKTGEELINLAEHGLVDEGRDNPLLMAVADLIRVQTLMVQLCSYLLTLQENLKPNLLQL